MNNVDTMKNANKHVGTKKKRKPLNSFRKGKTKMSEFTKGELEVIIGKHNYHKLCRVSDTEHKDILENLPTEQAIAYLKELVRRWNAFEEDGLVADLMEACHNTLGAYDALKVTGLDKELPGYEHCLKFLKAAIAKAEK